MPPTLSSALPALIACVDSNEDVLLLLRDQMVDAGYRAVTFTSPIRYGPQPAVDFLTYLAPRLAIYNISPPYRQSWAEYEHLCREVPECPIVPTTTNKDALERMIGPSPALEVLVNLSDVETLLAAVQARLASLSLDGLVKRGAAQMRSDGLSADSSGRSTS